MTRFGCSIWHRCVPNTIISQRYHGLNYPEWIELLFLIWVDYAPPVEEILVFEPLFIHVSLIASRHRSANC